MSGSRKHARMFLRLGICMSCAPAYEQSCGVSRRESPDRGGTANCGRSAKRYGPRFSEWRGHEKRRLHRRHFFIMILFLRLIRLLLNPLYKDCLLYTSLYRAGVAALCPKRVVRRISSPAPFHAPGPISGHAGNGYQSTASCRFRHKRRPVQVRPELPQNVHRPCCLYLLSGFAAGPLYLLSLIHIWRTGVFCHPDSPLLLRG